MTSLFQAAVIGMSSALARKAQRGGLVGPDKAIDEALALLMPTPKGRALRNRLSIVGSSVTMANHRSVPLSSSANRTAHVTAAWNREVMS